ncbi:hypothetical protein KDK95_24930, partial [Actinospica sp. MGRD01-02]
MARVRILLPVLPTLRRIAPLRRRLPVRILLRLRLPELRLLGLPELRLLPILAARLPILPAGLHLLPSPVIRIPATP